jgi:DNA-binding transcriptional regulator YiaG
MTVRQETRRSYAGLAGVLVERIQVRHCPACGAEERGSPGLEQLHTQLARLLACKEGALTAWEVCFLRTYLGLSASDLARHLGVTRETVCRWERTDKPLAMGFGAERRLRLMAVRERPVID